MDWHSKMRFQSGDSVTVRLTAKHELGGTVAHPALFVAYLLGQEGWAAVDLHSAHSVDNGHPVRRLHVPVEAMEPPEETAP